MEKTNKYSLQVGRKIILCHVPFIGHCCVWFHVQYFIWVFTAFCSLCHSHIAHLAALHWARPECLFQCRSIPSQTEQSNFVNLVTACVIACRIEKLSNLLWDQIGRERSTLTSATAVDARKKLCEPAFVNKTPVFVVSRVLFRTFCGYFDSH